MSWPPTVLLTRCHHRRAGPAAQAHVEADAAPAHPGRCPAKRLNSRAPALLAQLVEHFHGKEGVIGSSPMEGSLIYVLMASR